jgi:hypothetical protein
MSHLPRYSGERRLKSSGSSPPCGLSKMPQSGVDCDRNECGRNCVRPQLRYAE